MDNKIHILNWIMRVVAAFIMLQTLFFKFTGAPESIYIFETIGAEPFGRYASGIAELVASVLLLIPRTTWLGALLGTGIMSGAILSHVTILGIEVMGDGGTLFGMAILVFLSCGWLLFIHRADIPFIGSKLVTVKKG
jgi:uncharacterized membrane protein YphA (DoxX/SURF4 family)